MSGLRSPPYHHTPKSIENSSIAKTRGKQKEKATRKANKKQEQDSYQIIVCSYVLLSQTPITKNDYGKCEFHNMDFGMRYDTITILYLHCDLLDTLVGMFILMPHSVVVDGRERG